MNFPGKWKQGPSYYNGRALRPYHRFIPILDVILTKIVVCYGMPQKCNLFLFLFLLYYVICLCRYSHLFIRYKLTWYSCIIQPAPMNHCLTILHAFVLNRHSRPLNTRITPITLRIHRHTHSSSRLLRHFLPSINVFPMFNPLFLSLIQAGGPKWFLLLVLFLFNYLFPNLLPNQQQPSHLLNPTLLRSAVSWSVYGYRLKNAHKNIFSFLHI